VHLLVWVKSRASWANLLFSISAVSAAVCAGFELALMHAQTPAQFGEVLRWFHVPLAVMVVSLIWFVRQYLRSGRLWLVWLFCGMRVVTLILTFSLDPNLNFREITGLHSISAWGETVVSPIGVKNPWTNITHASGILLLVFVIDAGITAWRKGNRQRASLVTATFGVAIVTAITLSELLDHGVLPVPFTLSLVFLVIVLGMAYELSVDMLNANRLARELSENQKRLSLATQAAHLDVWEWDVIRDEIWVSDNVRPRMGLGESERPNLDRFLQSLHPDDREPTRRRVQQALEAGKEYQAEFRSISSGEVRWIAARGQVERGANGKPLLLRGVSMDVTERKRAEEQLRQSEAQLQTQFVNSPAYIVVIERDYRISMINRTGTSLPLDEVKGRCCLDLLPPEHRDEARRRIDECFSTGRRQEFEHKLANGIWVRARMVRMGDGSAADRVMILSTDITESKQAEAEMHRLQSELAHVARVSTLGQLSTALAHELNQPLGAILSNADAAEMLLDAEPPALDKVREILADIRKDDERAGEVIRRMRALLQKRELARQRLDVNELVQSVLELVKVDASRRGTEIRPELAQVPLPTRGDRVHLQQVLLNLLVNGMEAAASLQSPSRRLTVRTGRNTAGEIEVSVSDNGPGIPAEQLPRLFEPFFTTKPHGMGMGISIARTIIRAHNGRIWAENNPGGGALFRFTLPFDEEPEARQNPAMPKAEAPTPNKP